MALKWGLCDGGRGNCGWVSLDSPPGPAGCPGPSGHFPVLAMGQWGAKEDSPRPLQVRRCSPFATNQTPVRTGKMLGPSSDRAGTPDPTWALCNPPTHPPIWPFCPKTPVPLMGCPPCRPPRTRPGGPLCRWGRTSRAGGRGVGGPAERGASSSGSAPAGEEAQVAREKMDSLRVRFLMLRQSSRDVSRWLEQTLEASSRPEPSQGEGLALWLGRVERELLPPQGRLPGDAPGPLSAADREKVTSVASLSGLGKARLLLRAPRAPFPLWWTLQLHKGGSPPPSPTQIHAEGPGEACGQCSPPCPAP